MAKEPKPNRRSTVRGALLRTTHVERTVRVDAVQENELETVSLLNTSVTVCFSVGSALLLFAVGILADWAIEDSLTATGKVLVKVVTPICGVLAMGFYGAGVVLVHTRKTHWKRIRDESQEIT